MKRHELDLAKALAHASMEDDVAALREQAKLLSIVRVMLR